VSTRIKICGVREPDHARAAADHGAHFVGLVFHGASPRAVDRAQAERVLAVLPRDVEPVALLVGADPHHPVLAWWPGPVQLHGDETEETCAAIAASGRRVWRGFAATPPTLARWDACNALEALVADGATPGSGQAHDLASVAPALRALRHPALLAGGLDAANVGERMRVARTWGVDVSSGVERERGVKCPTLIAAFCRAVREADAAMA
jgi:phosphoribosylanthranilate isomerase